jgi:hypothetical protein
VDDLLTPPTEVEIGELLEAQTEAGKRILRRLAIQRDQLEASLREILPWAKHQSRGALCCADACFCDLGPIIYRARRLIDRKGTDRG